MKLKKILFVRQASRSGLWSGAVDFRDMLRYDAAFQSTIDPTLLAFPVFKTRSGDFGGVITRDRWRSFGVDVVEIPLQEGREILNNMKPEEYMTYQHPREGLYGPKNYAVLVPVSLAQYLAAKDLHDLEASIG